MFHGHKIFESKIFEPKNFDPKKLRENFETFFRNFQSKINWTFLKFQTKYQIMATQQLVMNKLLKR